MHSEGCMLCPRQCDVDRGEFRNRAIDGGAGRPVDVRLARTGAET